MVNEVYQSFANVLSLWQQMNHSEPSEAGADADRFQLAFYEFIDHVRYWITSLAERPATLEEAWLHPDLAAIFDQLPGPLQIPFETELEVILSGENREIDSTEQA